MASDIRKSYWKSRDDGRTWFTDMQFGGFNARPCPMPRGLPAALKVYRQIEREAVARE